MASLHHRIARRLTNRGAKWIVLCFWLIIVAAGGSYADKLSTVLNNEARTWLPQSAESTRAFDSLSHFQNTETIPTAVVYEKLSGLTDADLSTIRDQISQFNTIDGVIPATTPGGHLLTKNQQMTVSKDRKVAVVKVIVNAGKDGWNAVPPIARQIRDAAIVDGATIHLTGPGGQAADSAEAFTGLDGTLMGITLLAVVIVLLISYRSPLLWVLPVFTAVVALVTSMSVVYLLAKHAGLTVNGQSQAILTILVLGASTDYALLLIARYREELRRHADRHEAMAFALSRAAPAIIASALTVMVGMLCLMLADMNSTAGLGPVCAIGVGVGLLSMITLLPALLVIVGRWVFWPKRPRVGTAEPTASGIWAKIGAAMKSDPRRVWILTAIALGSLTLGLTELNTQGLTSEDTYTKKFDSIIGQEVLIKHKVADTSTPIQVVSNAAQAPQVQRAMATIPGIEKVNKPFVKGDLALIEATTRGDPSTPAAFALVDKVRNAVHSVPGADALVTGNSALLDDMQKAAAHDTKLIIPVVLGLVLLILMVLLRAIFAPILLILTVILSFGAALGIGSIFFKHVFGFDGADASFPLFVFVFLVALGIDYNIFLMTRVREESIMYGTRVGAITALSTTGGVITSAGIVLAATFGVLASLPLVFLVEMAFTVALGVLIDTIIVRSILVTALNLDFGDAIWWPSKLVRGPQTSSVSANKKVTA